MNTEIYNINSNLLKVPITLNSSFSLPWVPVGMVGYFLSLQWTGTPNGTFFLEGSGEPYHSGTDIVSPKAFPFFMWEQLINPTVGFTINGSSYSVVQAGKNAWNVGNARYSFVRLSYADLSSGTSTAQLTYGNLNQKG